MFSNGSFRARLKCGKSLVEGARIFAIDLDHLLTIFAPADDFKAAFDDHRSPLCD
jgi:hypothetical protein